MADTVTTQVLNDGPRNYVIRLTNISDATGETNVVKVDKSTLVGVHGTEPDSLALVSANCFIQGFEAVKLTWDHTADVTFCVLAGDGFDTFHKTNPINDTGSGGTGDILLSTVGVAAANDTYDITLHFKKKG